MINNYLKDKPDGILAYQSLLYGIGGKECIGNAFMYKNLAIYIMYDYSGNYMGEDIQHNDENIKVE